MQDSWLVVGVEVSLKIKPPIAENIFVTFHRFFENFFFIQN
jgi:hypothetical protein